MTGLTKGALTQTFENKAEPGTYEVKDFMESVAHLHEKTNEINKKAYDYGQREEGAEKVSLIGQNSQPKEHGPNVAETQRKKRHKELLELLKFYKLQEHLNQLAAKFHDMAADFEADNNLIKEALAIKKSGNLDRAIEFLIARERYEEGMTPEQVWEEMDEYVVDTIDSQAKLLEEMIKIAEEHDKGLTELEGLEGEELTQHTEKYKQQLFETIDLANANGVDITKHEAIVQALEAIGWEEHVLFKVSGDDIDNEITTKNSTDVSFDAFAGWENSIAGEFNTAAQGQEPEPQQDNTIQQPTITSDVVAPKP